MNYNIAREEIYKVNYYLDMEKDLLKETQDKYATLTNILIQRGITITTMESCTSGLVASFITDIDNSSKAFKGSFVTYSNETKIAQGVSNETINKYGVYSIETSKEMAKSCKEKLGTNIGIGITGSIGIVDPNNSDSKEGYVFFTIDYLDSNSYAIRIENQGSKFMNKVYVANLVCLELLKVLKGGEKNYD